MNFRYALLHFSINNTCLIVHHKDSTQHNTSTFTSCWHIQSSSLAIKALRTDTRLFFSARRTSLTQTNRKATFVLAESHSAADTRCSRLNSKNNKGKFLRKGRVKTVVKLISLKWAWVGRVVLKAKKCILVKNEQQKSEKRKRNGFLSKVSFLSDYWDFCFCSHVR